MVLVFRSHLAGWIIRSVLVSLFLSIGASLSLSVEEELVKDSVFFPSGVADPSDTIAYVSSASGIEAINLQDGSLRWTTDSPARPLVVSDGKLIAQEPVEESDNSFKIVALNASDGKIEFRSSKVRMDYGTTPGLREQEITFAGSKLEAGYLTLNWTINAHYRGGANPPVQGVDATNQDTILTVRLSLRNWKLEVSRKRQANKDLSDTSTPEVHSVPYVKNSTWHRGSWVVGKQTANLIHENSNGETYFVLEIRDNPGISLEQRVRIQAGSNASPVLVTPDGKYLVLDFNPRSKSLTHSWVVYSVETGQKLGQIESRSVIQEPSVVGEKIFFIVEDTQKPDSNLVSQTLCAVDLQTVKPVWKRVLRTKSVGKGPKLPQ